MKKLLGSTSIILLMVSAGAAIAADLPSKKSAPTVVAPAPLWTGLYVGANAGYAWMENNGANVLATPNLSDNVWGNNILLGSAFGVATNLNGAGMGGFIGGAQFGYNYQLRSTLVIGLEADIQGLTGHHISPSTGTPFAGVDNSAQHYPFSGSTFVSASKSLDDFGTVRARFGYLVTPTLLAFGTAGIAYGQVGSSTNVFQMLQSQANAGNIVNPSVALTVNGTRLTPTLGTSGFSETRIGWTIGGGLEWMVTPNWSVKAEYLYYHLGKPNTEFGITSYGDHSFFDNVHFDDVGDPL